MQVYEKELADTDSIYCQKPTNSHQSSIFIGPTDGDALCGLLGADYASDMDVVIVLSKANLLLNVLYHYLDGKTYFKRSGSNKWEMDKPWLLEKQLVVEKVFLHATERFHVSINKEATRTYLKGIAGVKPEGLSEKLDIRNYLFSGDRLHFKKLDDGSISVLVSGRGDTILNVETNHDSQDVGDERSLRADRRYWLIAPGEGANYWDDWIRGGIATIGWPFLGDLTTKNRKAIQSEIDAEAADGKTHTNNSLCCWQFSHEMSVGDVVISKHGTGELLGLGFVDGEYAFGDACGHHKHFRKVRWIKTGNFKSQVVLDRKTLTDITPYPDYLLKILESMGIDPLTLNDKPEQEPELDDVLEFALLQFKMHRGDPEWAGNRGENDWTSWSVNTATREYYSKLSAEKVHVFTREQFVELFCGVKNEAGKITFSPMWSGSPGQGWNSVKEGYEENPLKVISFLEDIAKSPAILSLFTRDDFERPKGFGKSVISELLMKFHPDCCFKYGSKTVEVLKKLGLLDFVPHSDYKDTEYKRVLGIAATIKDKMTDLKITRTLEDSEKPDYLTVNEFVGWVFDQKDELFKIYKEKVMSKQWKSVNSKDKVKNGTRKLSDALSGNDMLKRLVAALRTKPFAILAGHSGTGKSQLVRRLAYMTCNNELLIKEGEGKTAPGNYCMVQVKPNWHDSTDLLGYYSEMGERHFVNTPFVEFICKAYAYPDTLFFVCLDEMNLAPVEQYFAEYLSAIESMENKDGVWLTDPLVEVDKTGEKDASGKEKVDVEIVDQIMKGAASKEAADWIQTHGLTIPKNLFVVGTVNMDETTCQFSRKVLDRAMTLLMNGVKFSDMAASKKPSEEDLLDEAGLDFFLKGEERGTVGAAESALLDGINEPLANTPFVVAYRFANEYALYEAAWLKLNAVDLAAANEEEKKKYAMEALDHVVMMKLLPRIHGERGTVRVLFEGGKRGDKNVPGLESKLPSDGLSVDMMKKILERRDEYLTFWP